MASLRRRGISQEARTQIVKEEMVKVVRDMVEARIKIKKLQPQVDIIERRRKASELIRERNQLLNQ